MVGSVGLPTEAVLATKCIGCGKAYYSPLSAGSVFQFWCLSLSRRLQAYRTDTNFDVTTK